MSTADEACGSRPVKRLSALGLRAVEGSVSDTHRRRVQYRTSWARSGDSADRFARVNIRRRVGAVVNHGAVAGVDLSGGLICSDAQPVHFQRDISFEFRRRKAPTNTC
jgi:hypothetical protein